MVQSLSPTEDRPAGVADNNLIDPGANIRVIPDAFEEPGNGKAGSSGPTDNDVEVSKFSSGDPAGIEKCCKNNYRCTVLIIMHDRNPDVLQGIFNFKTLWCSNVLQINTTKDRCNTGHQYP